MLDNIYIYDKEPTSVNINWKPHSNNKVVFGRNFKTDGLKLNFESADAVFMIGDNSYMTGRVRLGKGCSLIIGKDFLSPYSSSYFLNECTDITIGNDCMFASGCILRTDDAHAIYDIISLNRINKSKNIIIGDHVWLCEDVLIMKGSVIRSGCVVGARSVLSNKTIHNNSLIAGNPVKYIRNNIAWEKPYLGHPAFKEIKERKEFWNYTVFSDLDND